MGNQMAWQETGTIDKFRWNTANDELVCPICGERNQQEYPLSELATMMPAHPNCRCWATPIVSVELVRQQRLEELGLEP
jgi:SPP1 gp7 family putative phage head morphogenesis protein